MRSIPPVQILVLWCLASLVSPSLSQTFELFQWQFANPSSAATSIVTCASLPIIVKSFDPSTGATHGTPPYYMIAFAVGQAPQTTLIGTDENNLIWTVTQPFGSQLILSVVDANGSSGGTSAVIYTVMAGRSTQCAIPPPTGPTFTVAANVTTNLSTCQPWGLTVNGGVPPYVLTLLQTGPSFLTNVTMSNGTNEFTYINRADPDTNLIAAISDSTGRWATGTPLINTNESNDISCAAEIRQVQNAPNANMQGAKRRRSTITGVVVALMILLFGGLALAAFLYLRKRKREDQAELAQQYVEAQSESKMLTINNYLNSPSSNQPVSRKAAILAEIHPTKSNPRGSPSSSETKLLSNVQRGLDRSASATLTNPATVISRSPSHTANPGSATFPATSIRRSARVPQSGYPDTGIPDALPTGGLSLADGELVFQHRDGGLVRELPPPYADRL